MPELLLEIGTEELPAGFIDPALAFLEKAVDAALTDARLAHGTVTAEGTPRRLCVIVDDVADRQADREEEITGPSVNVAFVVGADGAKTLTQAGEGFLKKNGLTLADVYEVDSKKGRNIAAKKREAGKPAREILGALLEQLLPKIPFKKTMAWGDAKATHKQVFGRPVQWILALHGPHALEVRFADVVSGTTTRGHRYHAPQEVTVKSVSDYRRALERGQVVLSRSERKQLIVEEADKLAKDAGGKLLRDDALLEIVKNLVEKPFPILGTFEERFLEMPKELLVSEMREHQKYFAVVNDDGALLPCFVVVAGSDSPNDAARAKLAAGNARVLRARFEDGAFYFKTDREKPLAVRAEQLKSVVFQRELGTLAEKTTRIQMIAVHFATKLGFDEERKTRVFMTGALCKCDLVTGVVGEFPELQGIMGRTYALQDGVHPHVAQGIDDHYAPRHAGAALPWTNEGAIVGIADRIDTIMGILGIGKGPTGSADPFALRRAAIGCAQIMIEHGYRVGLSELAMAAVVAYRSQGKLMNVEEATLIGQVVEFVRGRVRGVLVERANASGLDGAEDIVDAAMAARAGVDDLPDAAARVLALAELRANDPIAFASLCATFKRVGNILKQARDKKIEFGSAGGSATLVQPAETKLLQAISQTKLPTTGDGAPIEVRRGVVRAVVELKPTVDKFFDDIMVMAEDVQLRNARLGLLSELQEILVEVADFTKVQVDVA